MSDRDPSGTERAAQGSSLPERIEPDAILEALIEFRFEPAELPEAVLGRLLDIPLWAEFGQTRLPMADMPQPLREMSPDFRYQPLVELRKGDGSRVVKIGGRVMSYHVAAPYPLWTVFQPEIEAALREVIGKLKSPQISRIGLRYINVLRPDDHYVRSVQDTNITLKVRDDVLSESLAIHYIRSFPPNHMITVKVATPDLIVGMVPPGFSLLCDIDVATKPGNVITELADALAWIEDAHTLEKAEFFGILPEAIKQRLAAKSGGNRHA